MMEPHLTDDEIATLVTALKIALKKSHLILKMEIRLTCRAFDRLLLENTQKLSIDFITSTNLSNEDLNRLISKVRVSNLELSMGPIRDHDFHVIKIPKLSYGKGSFVIPQTVRELSIKTIQTRLWHIRSYAKLESFIPFYLTKLVLWGNFNQPLDLDYGCKSSEGYHGFLPLTLEHLELGNCFNKPVDNLPLRLSVLKIGNKFNKPVDNLPPNLRILIIRGMGFNQSVDNLPSNLQRLHLFL